MNENTAITATKHANFLSPDAKGNHQRNLSQENQGKALKDKPKKRIAFKDDATNFEETATNIEKTTADKSSKKIIFQENVEENQAIADRGRSRTNCGKSSIAETWEIDAKIPKRSKSCDTGKTFFERQSKEIDELFEVLTNFQSFKLRAGFFNILTF